MNYSGVKITVFWDVIPYYLVIMTNISDKPAFQEDEDVRMFCEVLVNSCQTTQYLIPDDIHSQHFGNLHIMPISLSCNLSSIASFDVRGVDVQSLPLIRYFILCWKIKVTGSNICDIFVCCFKACKFRLVSLFHS